MGDIQASEDNASPNSSLLANAAIKYAHQAGKLSHVKPEDDEDGSGTALKAEYITPQDPVIVTGNGGRLPGVPLVEAEKLNILKAGIEGKPADVIEEFGPTERRQSDNRSPAESQHGHRIQKTAEGSLRRAMPPSRTNPLFPPLPLYGPSSIQRDLQCFTFRFSSFFLSLGFLAVVVLGAAFTSIPMMFRHIWLRMTFRDPDARRPFHEEEKRRRAARKAEDKAWKRDRSRGKPQKQHDDNEKEAGLGDFVPTEGGPDPIICDVGYYARRVGLDMEEIRVQTEDGFIILLWHIYDPREFTPMSEKERDIRGPEVFKDSLPSRPLPSSRKPKFPVLLIHGLLQSAGAYCTNDDSSLAFWLCKNGYDVWLGNNRCGFKPEHTLLTYSDPRMWAWNIRQMGVIDLPALTSRVLSETGFEKLALVGHSQGTTETFVALAKEQRPDLGDKLTVFCALAPAAYAGPLIGKAYFKFMRVITPAMFRIVFGIHAFIPFMMQMHQLLPGTLYGAMGYRVFSFLFDWTDDRWDRGLRDRMFQFAPVYVSAESMRWWLGRECFAKQRCILATREEGHQEDVEDEMEDYYHKSKKNTSSDSQRRPDMAHGSSEMRKKHERHPKGSTAWYNEHVPPFALWIAGHDALVNGERLLQRFKRGREPHVRIVHSKVIPEYEHLDVIWAMDVIEKVGNELKEVIWKTCDVRDKCRLPVGCENIEQWKDPKMDAKEVAPESEESDGESSSDA